ncbi:RraA family protein [Agrococcus sp. ARC_14]|uniref:RraA family protein n=1 Tax=Agrococcus sp. ARC_14 TaxID=2919927 RepID=UPI001F06A0BE|nr:RraA family protein [Agrococcus sp. ARC_14]MCH1881798.1 RraA family protein [Agrococcus sp. ARC_14]
MEAAALVAALAHVELPTLGHTLEEGFCGPGVRPVGEVRRTAGIARTLDLVEPDALAVNEALLALQPGEMLVIAVGSGVHAPVGAVTSAAARARGAAGIVVGGPVTDVRALAEASADLPVWSTGATARTTKRLGAPVRLDVPVRIGDAEVHPGDVVAGDEHGVLVLRPAAIEQRLLDDARASDEAEPALLASLAAGEPLENLLARAPQEEA